MIVLNKEDKDLIIPNGLGNINIIINGGGGDCPDCPDCPELEEITINENGTYEGAYDRVIVDVPQEGGGINPDVLREITITENGRYTSKYSEPIKTGEFEDGTPFYGYGKVDGAVYDTQINLNEIGILESLEFWYKGDGQDMADGWNEILSSNSEDSTNEGSIEFRYVEGNSINVRIGGTEEVFELEEGVWHHFKLNKTGDNICTLWVDDVEMYSFPLPTATSTNFYINGTAYDEGTIYSRNANGYFGLININGHIIIPTENGFMNYNTNTILPTLKGGFYTYGTNEVVDEGEPYKTINVNIPPAKLQEKFEYRDNVEELFTILPDEGYDGISKVDVGISYPLSLKFNEGLEQGKTEGKESVISSLQTLNVTENGTYTPPSMSFLRLDGDDKYEMFYPSEVNAFEIKFRVNSDGDTEFFSQSDNNITFIGLRAYTSLSLLYVNWYNKQISISGVDFEKWHTLVVKMSDENARVIFDGQVYNDYNEWSSYENNGSGVNVFGNIDLEHFTFWETWEQYNNGETPFYNFKVTSEGLMKNYAGGEYEVVNNIGGGYAQYIEGKDYEGWKEVVVDIKDKKLAYLDVTRNGNYTPNTITRQSFLYDRDTSFIVPTDGEDELTFYVKDRGNDEPKSVVSAQYMGYFFMIQDDGINYTFAYMNGETEEANTYPVPSNGSWVKISMKKTDEGFVVYANDTEMIRPNFPMLPELNFGKSEAFSTASFVGYVSTIEGNNFSYIPSLDGTLKQMDKDYNLTGVSIEKGDGNPVYYEENVTFEGYDGWYKIDVDVKSDVDGVFGPLLPLLEDDYKDALAVFDSWDAAMATYQNENSDNTSSTGMMYQMNIDAISGRNTPIVDKLGINSLIIGTSGVWIKNNLVRPWVYQERADQTNIKILPEYWYGGFDCRDVEYIDAVFEGAETMKMFTSLRYLGQSFTGVQTLDLSSTDFLVKKVVYFSTDCYKEIANSVYDFTTPNANGVSYSNVKLPAKATEEARNLWLSKGWRIVE